MVFHINTVKSLRRRGLLDGEDSTVWTNQCGVELLDDIRHDTGILFDTAIDELIVDQALH
jgi:hypothetical protein